MFPILRKELNTFFYSPIAYLVIGIYLLLNGLYLWVFNSDFNILHAGFADLNSYFFLAPWIFIFLIPAITMRSFSEEINAGTIEILKTAPITHWQLVLGKFAGSLLLVIIAIIPTLIYVYSIYMLGNPVGNIHLGTTIGSFLGLLFLASAYTAIGIFASTGTTNQIVSFIIGVVGCFLLFYGFDTIANLFSNGNLQYNIQQLGMNAHFNSMSKGVLDTRDIIYFCSITFFFLYLTKLKIQNEK